ncbi:DJ-1/PfpI family protein [Bacillus carboniphilus]|uniref:DJ-1/PfpI family protein n=1 Tax=Bacillus carboniphilus TaxID=86663 RepID=A0ABY9JSJ7_9BACI|nr:DJ-1/PfpI family protein [Bacillus carboniphilus]WLR41385.1 DJ-1/PfpI family protein [Bacillus carboniphilus]
MNIGFILYDEITALDFFGFYNVITALKEDQICEDVNWKVCAFNESIKDEFGLKITVDKVKPDLSQFDAIFIPGGSGTRKYAKDKGFISWLRTAEEVPYKISVCTGSILLGAAGLLQGKKATTHPHYLNWLVPLCEEVVEERIVRDGDVITGGGVSTSIDLGLYFLQLIKGEEVVRKVQNYIDYPYYPSIK